MRHLVAVFALGCAAAHEPDVCVDDPVATCDVGDGASLVFSDDYGEIEAVSSCAICAMVERAFRRREIELGCCEPYPLDFCPLAPSPGCYAFQATTYRDFVADAINCRILVQRVTTIGNWTGFECGGDRRFAEVRGGD